MDDIYEEGNVPFTMDKATAVTEGTDVAIIACGEMVKPAVEAAALLKEQGISAAVVDMYCSSLWIKKPSSRRLPRQRQWSP